MKTSTRTEADELARELMAYPRIVEKIQCGMGVKEAVLEELNAWAAFVAKTDRSTEKGRAIDNIAREGIFNHLWDTLQV